MRPIVITSLLAATLTSACTESLEPADTVSVGVLLPFTGRTGGAAHSFERAVLTAARQLGETSLGGESLRIVFADTHSSVERGIESARTLLDRGVVAIIGVESDELAAVLRPELAARDVLLLSPNVSSAVEAGVDAAPWFRIAPSTAGMAENLAKTAFERGTREVAMLHAADRFDTAFAQAFEARFVQLGGVVSADLTLPDDRQSYGDTLRSLGSASHVLLAAPPEIAARVVNDASALRTSLTWYLTPALRTEVFSSNTVPGALVGSLGVAPRIDIDPAYKQYYAALWDGEPPLESSLLYYDTAALFALAYARAVTEHAAPSSDDIASSLFEVARSNGIQTRWNEIPSGVEDLEQGRIRYYRGLTGPIVFDAEGQRGFGQPTLWTVSASGELLDVK